jgi:hypothetical protein
MEGHLKEILARKSLALTLLGRYDRATAPEESTRPLSPGALGVRLKRSGRRWALAGVTSAAGVFWTVAATWACVPVATVTLTPAEARPGDELTVSGIRFATPSPVVVRLHSMEGPILATLEMPRSANTLFSTKIRVPHDAAPGPLVVMAMQDPDPETGFAGWGVPARAVVTVLDADGRAPPTTISSVSGRPQALVDESVDVGLVVLLVLGVAAGALVLAGAAAFVAGRRSRHPSTATAPHDPRRSA